MFINIYSQAIIYTNFIKCQWLSFKISQINIYQLVTLSWQLFIKLIYLRTLNDFMSLNITQITFSPG